MDTLTIVAEGGKLLPKRGVSAVAVMSSVAINHSVQMLFGVGEWSQLEKVGEQCSRVGQIVLLSSNNRRWEATERAPSVRTTCHLC